MALQLKANKANRWKTLGVPSAVVLGSVYIVLRTFPHLKVSLYNYMKGQLLDSKETVEDNNPIELKSNDNDDSFDSGTSSHDNDNDIDNDIVNESMVDVSEWSNDNLKSWLQEVRT